MRARASRLLAWLLAACLLGCSGKGLQPGSASPAGAPFSLEERGGVSWLFDPTNRPFFSLGVCVINQGALRDGYDPARPAYAAWHHYGDSTAWADATARRLRGWGFTTAGGWADAQALRTSRSMDLALTPVLAAGMEAGVPWLDLWDPAVVARVESLVEKRVDAVRGDPRLLGYFTDNEMGWWNGALLRKTFEHPPGSGQRKLLVRLLRETYGGDWPSLLRDFDPEGADDFPSLERTGILYLRPGGGGIRVARRFLELVAERYYELLGGLVRRRDPRGLVLGDRFQSFYYPEVARAAAKHVDVVSTNLNAQWSDGTFTRFFLDTLHDLTGRPIIVSEVYMVAAENRSGDPNSHGLYPIVTTQAERAAGIERTLAALLDLPYVVGVDWFQYYDEPPGGRFDGEDFNFGLVDIHDREYEEVVSAFRGIEANARHARASRERPDARGGVPRAPADPFARFEPNLALREWDRVRGFVPPASRFPLADLYAAWDERALYLGLFAIDVAEEVFYRDARIPEVDRMEWTVQVEGLREPVRVRLGAGLEPVGAPAGVRLASLSGGVLSVRIVACLEVPAALAGRAAFARGDVVRVASALTTHARAYRTEWKGDLRLGR